MLRKTKAAVIGTVMAAVMGTVLAAMLGAGLLAGGAARAQDKPAGAGPAAAKEAAPKKPRGRLPAYYARFVSQEQREKIYLIQTRYVQMMEKLRNELAALGQQRDKEVRDVLSDEQRKEVDELVEEARARRRGAKPAPAKPADPAKTGG